MTVLFTSQDPGAVQSILPIIRALPAPFGKKFFLTAEAEILNNKDISDYCQVISVDQPRFYEDVLQKISPQIVVTGTSRPHAQNPTTIEQKIISLCHHHHIPSLSLLDYWGDYNNRFSDYGGSFNINYVANKVCALDRISYEGLLKAGIPSKNLIITHNPYFDTVIEETQIPSAKNTEIMHILFISQAHRERNKKDLLGYDQFINFKALLDSLSCIKDPRKKKISIWLHPHEEKKPWKKIVKSINSEFTLEITDKRDTNFIKSVDLVCSAFSTSLYRFIYHGIPGISIQIGLKQKDELITNELGLTIPVDSQKTLNDAFSALDLDNVALNLKQKRISLTKQGVFFSDGRATKRVVEALSSMT